MPTKMGNTSWEGSHQPITNLYRDIIYLRSNLWKIEPLYKKCHYYKTVILFRWFLIK